MNKSNSIMIVYHKLRYKMTWFYIGDTGYPYSCNKNMIRIKIKFSWKCIHFIYSNFSIFFETEKNVHHFHL